MITSGSRVELSEGAIKTLLERGVQAHTEKRYEDAFELYRMVIDAEGAGSPDAFRLMGVLLLDGGMYDEARKLLEMARKWMPKDVDVNTALAGVYGQSGETDRAVMAGARAVLGAPAAPETHWNLALALITAGDYEWGFKEYEYGYLVGKRTIRCAGVAEPWQGQPIPGKTLLVHVDQGMGDFIEMMRFLPDVKRRSRARVLVEAPKSLYRLFAGLAGVDELVQFPHGVAEAFDYKVACMSLPLLCGVKKPEDVRRKPYLRVPSVEPRGEDRVFRIAFAWYGNPDHAQDHHRSMSLDQWEPFWEIPGVEWCSIQKGDRAEELAGLQVEDAAPQLGDFLDTARVLAGCDLLVSVDTSPIHLAGAMGLPVLMLTAFTTDFRWGTPPRQPRMMQTPWYDSVTICRQGEDRDWGPVVEMAKREIIRRRNAHTRRVQRAGRDHHHVERKASARALRSRALAGAAVDR